MSLWLYLNTVVLFLLLSIQRKKKLLGPHSPEKEPQLLMPFVKSGNFFFNSFPAVLTYNILPSLVLLPHCPPD